MTEYLVIALLWAASLAGVGWYAESDGHLKGINAQKVADQGLFDAKNHDLEVQKATAAGLYKTKVNEVLAKQAKLDELKSQLEKSDAQHKQNLAVLQRKYSGVGLRFKPAAPEAGGSGSGGGSSGSQGDSTIPATPATGDVQLPGPLTSDLRQLQIDAQGWLDAYRKCYGWVVGKVGG